MDVEHIINRATQFFAWLYYRRWERSELLAIVIFAVLAFSVLLIRAYLKSAAEARRHRGRSPIIGIRPSEYGKSHY